MYWPLMLFATCRLGMHMPHLVFTLSLLSNHLCKLPEPSQMNYGLQHAPYMAYTCPAGWQLALRLCCNASKQCTWWQPDMTAYLGLALCRSRRLLESSLQGVQ